MSRQLLLAAFSSVLLLISFAASNRTWAQWVTKQVGTPKCTPFTDPETGRKCFSLDCSTAPDIFAAYESCTPTPSTSAGKFECENVPACGTLDRAIACSTDPPKSLMPLRIATTFHMTYCVA